MVGLTTMLKVLVMLLTPPLMVLPPLPTTTVTTAEPRAGDALAVCGFGVKVRLPRRSIAGCPLAVNRALLELVTVMVRVWPT